MFVRQTALQDIGFTATFMDMFGIAAARRPSDDLYFFTFKAVEPCKFDAGRATIFKFKAVDIDREMRLIRWIKLM